MPPSPAQIRSLVTAYLDRHPGEHDALAPLTAALDSAGDPTSRSTLPGHVTCGAAVTDRADLELVHTVHMVDRPQGRPRIGLFFRAGRWEGVPEVREPDKCVGWRWWRAEDLPEPIVPYTRVAIEGIQAGRAYSELGWAR